jgi:hypothetical protein
VVLEVIMLNAFIFITKDIILPLVCLVIIDLLYVNASAMFEFIEEMLLNFLIFVVRWLFVVFCSIPGDYGFRGVTASIKA